MHQSHNIPWHLLATHFEPRPAKPNNSYSLYISNNINNTYNNHDPPPILLYPLNKTTQTSDLIFFCARFIRALNTFSTTARSKFREISLLTDDDSPLISTSTYTSNDRLQLLRSALQKRDENHARYAGLSVDEYREALRDARVLPLGSWVHGYRSGLEDFENLESFSDFENVGKFAKFELGADLTKALLDEGCRGEERGGEEKENGWESLLGLAHDEKPKYTRGEGGAERGGAGLILGSITYGQSHQQGWKAVGEMALESYLLLNIIMAVPSLSSPPPPADNNNKNNSNTGFTSALWKRWTPLKTWCRSFAKDNNTQTLPHVEFWRAVGVLSEDCFSEITDKKKWAAVDLFRDMGRVQEYLKKCWRLMYGCDLLMRECGVDPDWGRVLARFLGVIGGGVRVDEGRIREMALNDLEGG